MDKEFKNKISENDTFHMPIHVNLEISADLKPQDLLKVSKRTCTHCRFFIIQPFDLDQAMTYVCFFTIIFYQMII